MPVATSTQAGREVLTPAAEKILNDREKRRQDAQRAAAARADVLTPLGSAPPAFALETLPDPPLFEDAPEPDLPTIEIQTTVAHRGRQFTVVARGYTLDQLCDMLDKRKYAPASTAQLSAPIAAPDDLPEGWKLCKKHGAPMRPRNKQNEHWHSHNVGTADAPLWCKGYKGADSPGYEV